MSAAPCPVRSLLCPFSNKPGPYGPDCPYLHLPHPTHPATTALPPLFVSQKNLNTTRGTCPLQSSLYLRLRNKLHLSGFSPPSTKTYICACLLLPPPPSRLAHTPPLLLHRPLLYIIRLHFSFLFLNADRPLPFLSSTFLNLKTTI